jgi:SAM-dependent methyltransferase
LRGKKVLDLGCGYGEYMQLFGKGSVGITTTPHEVEYGNARGIDIRLGNVECIEELALPSDFDAIWANNLFEHLLAPHAFLMKLKTIAKPDATLILGVPVIPVVPSLMHLPKFRGALAHAHINFFTRKSLRLTAERAGWKVSAVRPFVASSRVIDDAVGAFMPHLYAIATNDSAFRYHEKKLKEWQDPLYQDLLTITGQAVRTEPNRAIVGR